MKERERNTAIVVGFIMILIFLFFFVFRFELYVRFHCFFWRGALSKIESQSEVNENKNLPANAPIRFYNAFRFAFVFVFVLFCFFKCADVLFRRYIFVK